MIVESLFDYLDKGSGLPERVVMPLRREKKAGSALLGLSLGWGTGAAKETDGKANWRRDIVGFLFFWGSIEHGFKESEIKNRKGKGRKGEKGAQGGKAHESRQQEKREKN